MSRKQPSHAPLLLWFRQDLRLADHPALVAAIASGRPVLCVYVLDDEAPGRWRMGGASRWWLHHSLAALEAALLAKGARLILRRGPAQTEIPNLCAQTGAQGVFWNRLYEPFAIARDTALKTRLRAQGFEAQSFKAGLLFEPQELKSGAGLPFKVFSPFWRAALAKGIDLAAKPAPETIPCGAGSTASLALDDLALLPKSPDWSGGLNAAWRPGEAGAWDRLQTFVQTGLCNYAEGRNLPGKDYVSRWSPHLHFGEISPKAALSAAQAAAAHGAVSAKAAEKFASELGWREFSHQLLAQFPDLPERNFRPEFDDFPWREDEPAFRAWTKGLTGYPIVDAGMRELWETGYMHNRVRMIAASFLIKHLLIDWRRGQDWFWDTLVDADLANNSASWQWVAGSGADAAPYFRIFNPILQGEKFDPDGAYVRRFVPELSRLPNIFVHRPWEAPALVLREAGVVLGDNYPSPIVDHKLARDRALGAFEQLKRAA